MSNVPRQPKSGSIMHLSKNLCCSKTAELIVVTGTEFTTTNIWIEIKENLFVCVFNSQSKQHQNIKHTWRTHWFKVLTWMRMRMCHEKKQNPETLEILLVISSYQRHSNENLFRAARQLWTLQVSTEDSWVLYLMVSWTCPGPTSRIKKRAARAVPRASQVNSWTVEYLASTKYEAQLAFKRTSSPGATWRSQPARPWSVARQEPRVKAEGLCHCVADVSNPSPPP